MGAEEIDNSLLAKLLTQILSTPKGSNYNLSKLFAVNALRHL